MFKDRKDAGERLAERLTAYQGAGDALVLALPRGGVIVGRVVADALHVLLDIVVVRKIGHPYGPEYAIGAVDAAGNTLMNEAEVAALDPVWLKEEMKREQEEAKRRIKRYRGGREAAALTGKEVIVVDDGIATGLSMRLAIASIKAQDPKKVILAVPVAPPSLEELFKREVDEYIVLEPMSEEGAVGAHYELFPQVEDEEVIALLEKDRLV